MAAFNFPNSPSTNDLHTENGVTYKWNGTVWKRQNASYTDATNLNVTGISTVGSITGVAATFTGNVQIGGVLTYEDVKNVDSVGIVTARTGIHIDDSITHIGDTNTKIRFPAADTFTVETNNTERFRITSTGAIGIGTNNPISGAAGARLAVHLDDNTSYAGGTARGNGIIVYNRNAGGHSSLELAQRNSANTYGTVILNAVDPADGNNYGADFTIQTRATGSGNYGERLRINSSGDVGIATASPATTLDVQGDMAVAYNATHALRFYTQPKNNWSSISNTATDGNANLSIKVSQGEAINITYSKKVGIGTDDPAKKLEVWDATQGVIRIRGGGGGSDSNRKADLSLFASGAREYVVRADASDAAFKIIDVSGSNAERYRITSSGTHVFGGNTAAPIVDNGELLYRGNSTSTFESLPQSFYLYGDSLGHGSANAGTGLLFGGKYHSNGSITTFAGIHGIKENTTSDEYGGALVFGVRQNAASSWERLRIKADGKLSLDKGVTALLTPSQTTAATIGGGNMTGGSSWFNHTNGQDYYGVDGDHKLTNGVTYGKITARNTDAAITNAATGGHVYFLIAKTVGGTLGNSNWKVENVAGWKMKWPSSLAAGATTTFYMRDAVESFGSPTVPDSGDYYIAWFFSNSQDMGTRGSSWFVDDATGGKIYYDNNSSDLSNPGQHIPSHNDSWDGTMTGEKIHFRYETLPVADLTGTVLKSPLLVDPIMQGTPTYDGHPMTGGSLVKWVEWDSNTASIEYSSASFTDSAYLIHYSLTGNPGWYQTRFQFMNADKTVFSDSDHYISHSEWCSAASTSASINQNVNASAGTSGSIWLCGNGTSYGHAGWVWVIPSNIRHNFSSTLTNNWQASSIGSDEINHFFVRGHSYLTIGNVPGSCYREEGGGQTRFGGYNVSGFRLYGCNSSSNNGPDSNGSHNGWVSIYRYKRGV